MQKNTKTRLVIGLFIIFWVICVIFMLFSICEDVKAESIEILITEYPFWAKDSTFQTVQVVKCWTVFPNKQRELLGYKVTVDSSGIRTCEEKLVWFLRWAVHRALSLRNSLAKKQKGD